MDYPGTNTIKLSHDALKAIVADKLKALLGGARIERLDFESYPTGLTISFTTDPKPAMPEAE